MRERDLEERYEEQEALSVYNRPLSLINIVNFLKGATELRGTKRIVSVKYLLGSLAGMVCFGGFYNSQGP